MQRKRELRALKVKGNMASIKDARRINQQVQPESPKQSSSIDSPTIEFDILNKNDELFDIALSGTSATLVVQ